MRWSLKALKHMARNRKSQSAAIRFGPALKAFLLCLLIGGSGVGYVWQKDQIRRLGQQIKDRETRLAQLVDENQKRRKQLGTLRSPPFIEARVRELNLGLVAPQPMQVWRMGEPSGEVVTPWPGPAERQFAAHETRGPAARGADNDLLPSPVTPSDEEPIAAGERQTKLNEWIVG
jgi:cell division protein FtsB